MADRNIIDKVEPDVKLRCKEHFDAYADNEGIQSAIKAAVTKYSKDRPKMSAADITGDGGFDYVINSTNLPGYVVGFSYPSMVEYPYSSSQAVPQVLDGENWTIYHDGTNDNLRFLTAKPSSAQTIRVHYNIPRLDDDAGDMDVVDATVADIVDTDYQAVVDLSAAHFLRFVAAKLVGTGDSTLQADVVNYRSKSAELLRVAEAFEKSYKAILGITDEKTVPAASVDRDFDVQYAFGADHLTHPGSWH